MSESELTVFAIEVMKGKILTLKRADCMIVDKEVNEYTSKGNNLYVNIIISHLILIKEKKC